MVEFYLISYIYVILISNKILIKFSIAAFTVFIVINGVFIQQIYEQQTWLFTVESFILLILSMYYVYVNTFKRSTNVMPINFTAFWINAGVLFYFGLSLHLFVASNYFFKKTPTEGTELIWACHNFNNFLKNIFFAIAIYLFTKKSHDSVTTASYNLTSA